MQLIKNRKRKNAFLIGNVIKIADIIVKKFVQNKSIHFSEFDDMKQSIIEKYLLKQDKIETSFTGQSKPETYISAILYRMVLELLRNEKNKYQRQSDFETHIRIFERERIINPEEKLIIQNEKKYLDRVFATFGKEREKIILYIKFFYQVKISEDEIRQYAKNRDYNKLYEIFISSQKDMVHQSSDPFKRVGTLKDELNLKDKEIFSLLCEAHNTIDEKKVKPDAIRMYVNNNIKKILERLNGENNRTFYTKKTLGLLLMVNYE